MAQILNDLGMVSRELTAEKQKEFQAWAITRDGIGIIVNAENPVANLN